MHESIERGRPIARLKRIGDIFDLLVRQVQKATTHRSMWAVLLPSPALAGESAGGREEEAVGTNLLTSAASLTVVGEVRRRFMKPQQAGEGGVDGSGCSRPPR